MSEDPTKIKLQTNVKQEKDPTLIRMKGMTNHKHMEFDVPFISEIADNLWQGGCQNGLELPHFFKHVVSLYKWESYQVKHDLESYLVVTMFDSLDQSTNQVEILAQWVNECRKTGPVLVHCQAGLNRSSLVVVKALMQSGWTAKMAIGHLRRARSPASLCNQTFEDWLKESE